MGYQHVVGLFLGRAGLQIAAEAAEQRILLVEPVEFYDPVFEERAMATVKAVAEEAAGTAWWVRVFIDNEKSFGRPETNELRLGTFIHTLGRNGADVPTKRVFTDLMRDKYESIDALNSAWDKEIGSWNAFDAGIDSSIETDVQLADYSALLHAYTDWISGPLVIGGAPIRITISWLL